MDRDLIIIGAGPAGLAAAVEASSHGLAVTVLDENPAPGGRIWQALESRGAKDDDEAAGLATISAFRACRADAHWQSAVWAIDPDGTVSWSKNDRAFSDHARYILLATGATERPLPIPGWTLPGVMTVGAAQIALKTGGLVPAGATWIAGQGPLLLLFAVQALRAGGNIAGILDLSDGLAPLRALRHLPRALGAGGELAKGLRWRREISRAGIPWISAGDLRAKGDGRLQSIEFRSRSETRREPADLLLLHDGIMPSVQMTSALGCAHEWDTAQQCWNPMVDGWGATSIRNVFVAGDGAGIGGAAAAGVSGRIAALGIAHALGRIDAAMRDRLAAPLRTQHARHLAVRPFIDTLYAPRRWHIEDATIVCRCEEVTAREVRAAARLGCLGCNQLKALTRCGMGPCQGRMCSTTVAQLLAAERGLAVQQIEPYRTRFPTKPVSVGQLAAMQDAG